MLTEEIQVLHKLCLGMSYSAADQEFNVKDSTVILNKLPLNKNTHKTSYI